MPSESMGQQIKSVWLAQPLHLRVGQVIWLLGIAFIIGLIIYGYHTGELPTDRITK